MVHHIQPANRQLTAHEGCSPILQTKKECAGEAWTAVDDDNDSQRSEAPGTTSNQHDVTTPGMNQYNWDGNQQ